MPDASDYRADEETLWLTFLAPHRIKLRDIAPVEDGMGQFWRRRFHVASWPGLVLGSATESNGGHLCSLWLQSIGDRVNRAAPPSVRDFAAAIHRATTALRAGALPAADDCCDLKAGSGWLVDPTSLRPKPSVWTRPDYGIRSFLHAMRPLRVGIGTSILVTQAAMPSEAGGHGSAPLVDIVVRGGEWKALCWSYEALTRPSQPTADDEPFISAHGITDHESQ
jgi:hypothetical protein